jgi:LPS-assembly protein
MECMTREKANYRFKDTAQDGKRAVRLNALSLTIPLILALHGILILTALITPAQSAAQIGQKQAEKVLRDPNQPWQLEADEIRYDRTSDEYIAEGNVLIYKANIKLLADYVHFDHKNMQAYAIGNVVLTNGEDILSGTSLELDLEDQVGAIENGSLFLKANNYHLTGGLIKKVGATTYTIDEATLTTCDGERPDWKVTGKKLNIKENGAGSARHATLWARGMPVLYTPYFYYPARNKRQTGLLWPKEGVSDRWGYYYNQPFFWAIDDSRDATVYGNYMSARGMKAGLEYRYFLDEWSGGTLMADGFMDRQIDDGLGDATERWGFPDGDRVILRQNRDRYWLRMSHRQKMPAEVKAQLDLDIVSDQDYTRDFKDGYMGWKESKEFFEDVFSRNLDDYNDPIRTNRLNFNKSWSSYSLNAQTRYDLDSTIRNSHAPDTTLQQLPFIEFDGVKQKIATSPFFYNLDSEYVYYWSRDGQRTQRLDIYPRLYLPFHWRPYVTIEPSVGVRETLWYLGDEAFGPEDDKKFYQRGLFDTGLDLSSEIHNIFNFQGKTIDRIKHSIRPRILYVFIPDVEQDDLPDFDSIDRIEEKNLITYSLTNTVTTKSRKAGTFEFERRVDKNQAAAIASPSEFSYNDLLRFKLEQNYDLNVGTRSDPDQPFSPIYTELELFPGKYFGLDYDSLWSVYDLGFLSHNIAANLWDDRGDRLSVGYRYTKDSDEIELNRTESVYTALKLKVTDSLAFDADYEYNILADTLVEMGLGIFFKAQCWSFNGRVIKTPDNLNFELNINLFGLGEFGI